MGYRISKIVLIKTLLLTLGLGFIVILSFSILNKVNTQRKPDVTAENWQQSIPTGSEIARAASAGASQLTSNPDLQQSSLNVRVTPPIQSTRLAKPVTVSVKDFGAIGNGIADDTRAIQKAIDAVNESGGGVVFFPSGTYKVTINPGASQAIKIRPKLTLRGAGYKNTTLVLGEHQGNYNSILAGEKPQTDISDFEMYDLTIDANSTNNPIRTQSDIPAEGKPRYALQIFAGRRIRIERCRFTNQNNLNTITLNSNEELVSDAIINNNIFERIGGGNIDYDHSTIYTYGKRIEISNNYFSSRNGAGTNGARTAIEIHGDDHLLKANVIDGFTNGINITGYARSSNNQIVADNVIKEAYTGITIWSYFHRGNTVNPGLANCIIANNQITLNIKDWRKLWGDTSSAGIWLEPKSDAPIENFNILNNEITFTNYADRGTVKDNLANGINLWRYSSPNVATKNIRILGNKIKNSMAAGIYISMPIEKGEISQNTILNPGQSKGSFHDDYRAAMIVDGKFNDVKINENLLVDNQRINTMKGGIIWFGDCEAKCEVRGNSLNIASGAVLEIFRSKSPRSRILDRVSGTLHDRVKSIPLY
ncbi:glycosyl hydrolase family 28-related protein [Microcoleus sp. POL10_C6]|uniref:glycosyl hydrolase family 28-related protein n=1 Tax=Microcoleus sp. POL10_C6 TaxID=2818852 RepID=UPI002FCFFFCC